MEVDYIIVGSGIAGCTLAAELHLRGSRIALISNNDTKSSSRIAAGLINPIVPKRVIPAWNAENIFPEIKNHYQKLELLTGNTFYEAMPMVQIHSNASEYRQWKSQSEKPELHDFLQSFPPSNIHGIAAPYGYTNVNHCGRLDVQKFCDTMESFFEEKQHFILSKFVYDKIQFEENYVRYDSIQAQGVIFCEGVGIQNNPFFSHIPVNKSWGDILEISVSEKPDPFVILKQKHWCIPKSDGNYLCGSNFISNEGNAEDHFEQVQLILQAVREWFPVKSLIQSARGARPVMPDRRPAMGRHAKHLQLFVYNGLGTRGCSLITWLSGIMADYILHGAELPKEVRIDRFR